MIKCSICSFCRWRRNFRQPSSWTWHKNLLRWQRRKKTTWSLTTSFQRAVAVLCSNASGTADSSPTPSSTSKWWLLNKKPRPAVTPKGRPKFRKTILIFATITHFLSNRRWKTAHRRVAWSLLLWLIAVLLEATPSVIGVSYAFWLQWDQHYGHSVCLKLNIAFFRYILL